MLACFNLRRMSKNGIYFYIIKIMNKCAFVMYLISLYKVPFDIICGLFKYRRTFLETVTDTQSVALVGCGQ